MDLDNREVYSIGHSNMSYRSFASLLRKWSIEQVVDVRSIPFSRHVPHFNYEAIRRKLQQSGFEYEYLGNQLGSHNCRMRNSCENPSDYRRQIACDAFSDGITQLLERLNANRVAIMCVESNPYRCHRHTILAAELAKLGVVTQHIFKNAQVQSAFDAPVESNIANERWIQRSLFESLDAEPFATGKSSNEPLPRVA
ncbi:MAG: DUF488 domain-containing protein [Gammaproteobacteria bacterium]|nr:DUF488 domain-containing protein [Gammaproteobacteria bacterium]